MDGIAKGYAVDRGVHGGGHGSVATADDLADRHAPRRRVVLYYLRVGSEGSVGSLSGASSRGCRRAVASSALSR